MYEEDIWEGIGVVIMNILHYSLGFPPYRSGGMTTYCISLIEEQIRQSHSVSMMWPGSYSLKSNKTRIVETNHILKDINVKSYEIKNGLPVPLLDGIRETKQFQKPINKSIFDMFFKSIKFDVMHVHTLMGLPIECIESATENGVKTVFTTHDSFGICCKQGLFVNGHICDDHECLYCYDCNDTALSLGKISVLQSVLYRKLKDSLLIKMLRKKHNNQVFAVGDEKELKNNKDHAADYLELRNYYVRLLNTIRLFHYNSSLMKQVYESFGVKANSKVFLVSHKNIRPSFISKQKVHDPINIGYFGPINVHKGFFFLKEVLDRVYLQEKDFKLHIFNEFDHDVTYLVKHKPYRYAELSQIMRNIDLVVVPSQCYETFGFTALEALSFGVPVIVTENVGAKDLVVDGKNGFIESGKDNWINRIMQIINNPNDLLIMNNWIIDNQKIYRFDEYTRKIEEIYNS